MTTPDLSIASLIAAFALLGIPVGISLWLKLGIIRELAIAAVRMAIQLAFAAVYLTWLFRMDNPWVNIGWLLVMMTVAALTTVQKSQLRVSAILFPVCVATVLATVGVVLFFNAFIARIDNLFAARFLVVLGGMILGNTLSGNIVALTHFFQGLKENESRYLFRLGNGASQFEALRPGLREAVTRAIKPMLAGMATMGIVSLPGMMTGQILGGSSPVVATKYQIAIMTSIFAAMALGVTLAILLATRKAIDPWGMVRKEVYR